MAATKLKRIVQDIYPGCKIGWDLCPRRTDVRGYFASGMNMPDDRLFFTSQKSTNLFIYQSKFVISGMPIFRITDDLIFPHPSLADDDIIGIGGDLSPERLLLAYSNGIFPWPHDEESPMIWASPDPRLVLFPENYRPSRRLLRTMRQEKFQIKFDKNFEQVIRHCRAMDRPDQGGTWITREMVSAYVEMHRLGFAHSVEAYADGRLVGGLYGLSLGGVFCGESMFHVENDAAKAAFHVLVQRVQEWDFDFIDAQIKSPHLVDWGADEISRERYLDILKKSLEKPTRRGKWKNS